MIPAVSSELVFYEDPEGKSPVREYLDSLGATEAAEVTYDLQLLARFGTALGVPHARPIRSRLWELRTTGGTQRRMFYFALAGGRLVLLHAFTEKRQLLPPGEVEVALRRIADYLRKELEREPG
jgi:phage-related protein